MMKKRIFTVLIACVFLFGFTFTPNRFTFVTDAPLGNTIAGGEYTTDAAVVKEIATFGDLLIYGQDSVYNPTSKASASSHRVTLKLTTGTLKLNNDAVLSADCAIDLNGNTLDLNGHTLTIRHNYAGAFLLVNGFVTLGEETAGAIVLETPNAVGKTNAKLTGTSSTVTLTERRTASALAAEFVARALTEGGERGIYHSDVSLPAAFGPVGTLSYSVSPSTAMSASGKLRIADTAEKTDVIVTPTLTTADGTKTTLSAITISLLGKNNVSGWGAVLDREIAELLDAADGTATLGHNVTLPTSGYFDGTLSYTLSEPAYLVENEAGFVTVDTVSALSAKVETMTLTSVYTSGGTTHTTVYTLKFGEQGGTTQDRAEKILQAQFGDGLKGSQLHFAQSVSGGVASYTEYALNLSAAAKDLGLVQMDVSLQYNAGKYRIALAGAEIDTTVTAYPVESTLTDPITLGIKAEPQSTDSPVLKLTLTILEDPSNPSSARATYAKSLGLVYDDVKGDAEANDARFSTYQSFFEDQLKAGTNSLFDADHTFALDASYGEGIPYVAYRVLRADDTAFAVEATDGGITVEVWEAVAESATPNAITGDNYTYTVHTPTYDASGLFKGLDGTVGLADSTRILAKEGTAWVFRITPSARAQEEDVALLLEYQYSFTKVTSATSNDDVHWFPYTSASTGASVRTAFSLVGLVMTSSDASAGVAAEKCDFDNQELYDEIKGKFAPGFTYLPRKYLGATLERLDVKALVRSDTGTASETDYFYNAASSDNDKRRAKNFKWLSYLTGVEYLNLHGMHVNDNDVQYLLPLTQLTGLDISGIYDSSFPYETKVIQYASGQTDPETQNKVDFAPSDYSTMTTNFTGAQLESLLTALVNLTELNCAYCRIADFDQIIRGFNLVKAVVYGNATRYTKGDYSANSRGGSNVDGESALAAMSQRPLGLLSAVAEVYPSVANPSKQYLSTDSGILSIARAFRYYPYQRTIYLGSYASASEALAAYAASLPNDGTGKPTSFGYDGSNIMGSNTDNWVRTITAYDGGITIKVSCDLTAVWGVKPTLVLMNVPITVIDADGNPVN